MNDLQLEAWLDQEDKRTATTIRKFGWHIEYVGGGCCDVPGCDRGDPSSQRFAYTVGLFGLGHPELLIFGVSPRTAGIVLNELATRIREGEDFMSGQLLTFEGGGRRIAIEAVPNPGQIVFAANRHYQRPPEASVPVYQLTFDDAAGHFPWEADYAGPQVQPRPGTFHA